MLSNKLILAIMVPNIAPTLQLSEIFTTKYKYCLNIDVRFKIFAMKCQYYGNIGDEIFMSNICKT